MDGKDGPRDGQRVGRPGAGDALKRRSRPVPGPGPIF